MIYFTSDLHFGHKNVIEYCKRPFKDTHEMAEAMIKNYNEIVPENGKVYFLGDIFFCGIVQARELLRKMNGYKILIRGNHDRSRSKMLDIGFHEVHESLQIEINLQKVNLSHYPYRPDLTWMPELMKKDLNRISSMTNDQLNGKDRRYYIDEMIGQYLAKGKISEEQANEFNAYDLRFIDRRLEDNGEVLLCGHVHEKWKTKETKKGSLMINVGVDVWDFKPVHIRQIADEIGIRNMVKVDMGENASRNYKKGLFE